jgi:hypothetical protein
MHYCKLNISELKFQNHEFKNCNIIFLLLLEENLKTLNIKKFKNNYCES